MTIRYGLAAILILIASPLYADEFEKEFNDALDQAGKIHEQRMKTDLGYRHEYLGDKHAEKRQFKKAAEEYGLAGTHMPNDAALRAKWGHALVSSKRPKRGLRVLNKAIEMTSGKEPAWLYSAYLSKGTAHGMLNQNDEAIAALSKSLSLKPTVLGHVTRATAYAKRQELKAALRDLDAALKMKPESKKLWTFKAQLHVMSIRAAPKAGHQEKACHAMRKACEFGECRPLNKFTQCKVE